jgi:hypothetical protein
MAHAIPSLQNLCMPMAITSTILAYNKCSDIFSRAWKDPNTTEEERECMREFIRVWSHTNRAGGGAAIATLKWRYFQEYLPAQVAEEFEELRATLASKEDPQAYAQKAIDWCVDGDYLL